MTDESFVYNGKEEKSVGDEAVAGHFFRLFQPHDVQHRGSQVGQTAAFFERAGVPNHAQRNRVGGVCRKG